MNYHPQSAERSASAKLRRKDAAIYLREHYAFGSSSLLAKLAVAGGGPRYRKYGSRIVLYDPADLDEWVSGKLGDAIASTSSQA